MDGSTPTSRPRSGDGLIVVRMWCDGDRDKELRIRARVIEIQLEDTVETSTVCEGIGSIVHTVERAIARFEANVNPASKTTKRGDGIATQW